MRHRPLAAVIAAFALATLPALSPGRALADERDFTLVNGSPQVIMEVYVGPSDSNEWGNDVLGSDVLTPGNSVAIYFSGSDGNAGKCLYDIRVVAQNGGEGRMMGVNLCTTSTVTFQ